MQGNNRQKNSLLKSKYFTGGLTIDCNYNYNFVNPIDHTNNGSTATFRSNQFNISYIEARGEFYEPKSGARAKLMLQFGSRATGIPRIQFMPNEYITFGCEYVHRYMNVPYFSGRGGVTSPNGWNAPIGNPLGYTADLVNNENRIIFSTMFRF